MQSLQHQCLRHALSGLDSCLHAQHNALVARMDQLEGEAGEDVRLLARLWQLANKMESVGSEGSYGARIERAVSAIRGLELRLKKRLELLDGWASLSSTTAGINHFLFCKSLRAAADKQSMETTWLRLAVH
jgi:hypothetical protein